MGYIGKIAAGGATHPIGSTLYGICSGSIAASTAAKVVTFNVNENFDTEIHGVTVHVKFINGNTATNNVTLQMGASQFAYAVVGNCTCPAGAVLAFTFDDDNGIKTWRTNGQSIDTIKDYIDTVTNGITSAMHYRGVSTTAITPDGQESPTINSEVVASSTLVAGDVVIYNTKEFVWDGSHWHLMGDEGSYALKENAQALSSMISLSGGAAPTLGTAITVNDLIQWSAGSASSATVTNGVLSLTDSVAPSLTPTGTTIPNITNAGSSASLSVGQYNVVYVPTTTP